MRLNEIFFIKNNISVLKNITIICLLVISTQESSPCISHEYDKSIKVMYFFSLYNGNIIGINNTGIYAYNSDFSELISFWEMPSDISLSTINYDKNDVKEIVQFSEGSNIVLCLLKNLNLIILSKNGNFIYRIKFNSTENEEINESNFGSLVPYKYDNGNYYYFLCYKTSSHLYVTYYMFSFEANNNFLNTKQFNLKYWPSFLISTCTSFKSDINPTCRKMKYLSQDVLTCFFIGSTIYEISFTSFIINETNQHFDPILNYTESYSFTDLYYIKVLGFSTSDSKIFLCYKDVNKAKCGYFDIEKKTINLNEFECDKGYGEFFYYFHKSEQILFSCLFNSGQKINKILANKDGTIDNESINLDSNNPKYFTAIYISTIQRYSFMIFSQKNNKDLLRNFLILNSNSETCYNITPSNNVTIKEDIEEQEEEEEIILKNEEIEEIEKEEKEEKKVEEIIIEEEENEEKIEIIEKKEEVEKEEKITEEKEKEKEKKEETTSGECYHIKIDNEIKSECLKKNEKPSNYFINEIEKTFEHCYETCEKCNSDGNYQVNNCTKCRLYYIFQPETNDTTNCVLNCSYYNSYYYFSSTNEYRCTDDNQCTDEAKFLIPEIKKCTSDCAKETYLNYTFRYSGQCYRECPENTKINEKTKICEEVNNNKCSVEEMELNLNEEITKENIEKITKNYAEEFNYTSKHISGFINDKFYLIIYKDSECITEKNVDVPLIDFGDCYNEVKNELKINEDLIIAVIDKYDNDSNPETTYAFFSPNDGSYIEASNICKNNTIIVQENILHLLEGNNETALFFSEQNINIFDLDSEFYTDICLKYKSPNNKDIILKDRIAEFYPFNITFCDDGCKNKGVNLTSLKAICECPFKDILSNKLIDNEFVSGNLIVSQTVQDFKEMIDIIDFGVLTCYKTIFKFDYFISCEGGFIVIGIIIIQIVCIIIYKKKDMYEVLRFILELNEKYSKYLNRNECISNLKNNSNPPKLKKFSIITPEKKKKN